MTKAALCRCGHNATVRHSKTVIRSGFATARGTFLGVIIIIIAFAVNIFFPLNVVNAFTVGTNDARDTTADHLLKVKGNPTIYAHQAYSTTVIARAGSYKTSSADFTYPPTYTSTTTTIIPVSSSSNNNKAIPNSPTSTSQTSSHSYSPSSSFKATLNLPPNKYVEATHREGSVVPYSVSALDSLGNSIAPVCSPPSGSIFPLGKTTVICTVRDASGNTQSGSFEVIVQDTTPPSLTMPSATITAEATGPAGTVVSFPVSASDTLSGSITPICTTSSSSQRAMSSNSIFPLGKTTVICTVRDASGNTQSGSFEVIVQDTTPPSLTMPSATITAEATGPAGTVVSFPVSASDTVSGSITPICTTSSSSQRAMSSSSIFPLGKTTVICTVRDASGNTQSGSFEVIVQDTTPPDLIFAGSNLIARAQSRITPVSYSGYVSGSDLVDGKVAPVCSPPSGSLFPVGVTTVKCTATDEHGNAVSESFAVTVRYPTFSGFLPPVHPDGSSIFKLGTVIPIKFQLGWSDGHYVSDAAIQIYSAKISNSITGASNEDTSPSPSSSSSSSSSSSAVAVSTGNYFTYDHSKQQYVYNLQTKNMSIGTWQIKILLDDGSSPSVNISIQR